MVWEFMQKGMASAGWLIGFVVILGLFLLIVGLIGLAFMAIFGGNEEEEDPDANYGVPTKKAEENAEKRAGTRENADANYGVPTGKAKDAEEDDL